MGSLKMKLFLLSSLAFGMVSANAMTDAELLKKMKSETAPYFMKIKAPRLVFHWVDASDITPKGKYDQVFPANDPIFKAYVDKQGSKVYNQRSDKDRDMEGPGLYAASDPLASREYGGDKAFGLIVGLTRPEGRILAAILSIVFSSEVKNEINSRGCQVYTFTDLIDSTDPACTKIKQLLFGKDISFADGRSYMWSHGSVPGCNGRGTADFEALTKKKLDFEGADTYVVYNSNMFSKVLGFTHKSKPGSDTLANEVLSYLKGMQTSGASMGLKLVSAEQFKDKSIRAMTDKEQQAFSKKYIINCK